jgi:hypothetical protein
MNAKLTCSVNLDPCSCSFVVQILSTMGDDFSQFQNVLRCAGHNIQDIENTGVNKESAPKTQEMDRVELQRVHCP